MATENRIEVKDWQQHGIGIRTGNGWWIIEREQIAALAEDIHAELERTVPDPKPTPKVGKAH
jgi:hypothetical protein